MRSNAAWFAEQTRLSRKRTRRLAWIAALVLLYLGPITYLRGSGSYLLNDRCEATGLWDRYVKFLLGSDFWQEQANFADERIAELNSLPEQWERLDQLEGKLRKDLTAPIADFERKLEQLQGPTDPAEKALRERARALEEAADRLSRSNYIRTERAKLVHCKAIATALAKSD